MSRLIGYSIMKCDKEICSLHQKHYLCTRRIIISITVIKHEKFNSAFVCYVLSWNSRV